MSDIPRIDAYCHIGLPRFGTAEDAWAMLRRVRIARAVFVLGPGVPDYPTLITAMRDYGDRVRGIGIPFGATQAQIRESVALQVRAGVLGLRVEPQALLAYPEIRSMLGDAGRCLYAIGAVSSPDVIKALLAWLAQYPDSFVAAPHFLAPYPLLPSGVHGDLVRELVTHPRFYPIFSRHGGVGSRQPYPHPDLRDWASQVVALAGWDHILWGSEYPVLYWRDESIPSCQTWLVELLGPQISAHQSGYLGGNAERLLFGAPAPAAAAVTIPSWIEGQFNRDRTVPLFPGGVDIPMSLYTDLHHRYVVERDADPGHTLSFSTFLIQQLTHLSSPAVRRPIDPQTQDSALDSGTVHGGSRHFQEKRQ